MGETLSKPVTEKHTSTFNTTMYTIGCCGMQGWRKNMEDAHLADIAFDEEERHGLFGVYDGHNGYRVAKFSAANMTAEVLASENLLKGNLGAALFDAYGNIENTLKNNPQLNNEGGCTAVTVMVANNRVVCANTGDSRAVLCRKSGAVVPLSEDHKPTADEEVRRIEAAGSTIEGGRVNGVLGVSRAIGDFDFKDRPDLPWTEQAVTAKPDITEVALTKEDNFIVIACDGIWEVLSNEEVCKFVSESLVATKDDVGRVAEMLIDKCLAPAAPGLGCDNMSVVIVKFMPAYF